MPSAVGWEHTSEPAESIRLDLTAEEATLILRYLQGIVGSCRTSDELCHYCEVAHAVITKLGS